MNPGNGAPTWKGIAIGVIGLLVGLLVWVGRGVAQDVKDHEKRITILEIDVVNGIANLQEDVDLLRREIGAMRTELYRRRNP